MLIDAATLPDGTTVEADLCIIGAGMAGIAIARELVALPYTIALLESGGEQMERATQDLYRGQGWLSGPTGSSTDFSDYLVNARTRLFGGSGNVWGGKCGRLEPIDFEKRSWVPHSGWPFSRDALDPFYDRAAALLGLPSFRSAEIEGDDPARPKLRLGRDRLFTTVPRRHSPVTGGRPGPAFDQFKRGASDAPRARVYLHANVTDIRLNPAGSAVERLVVRCLNGKVHEARARHYVLACGGIENARLLLQSDGVRPNGVGNDRDLVGRFFCGHINYGLYGEGSGPSSGAAITNGSENVDRYTTGDLAKTWGVLNATKAAQSEHRLLNFWATFTDLSYTLPAGDRATTGLAARLDGAPAGRFLPIRIMVEQEPNPDSRITLGDGRDELGQRRPVLDWRISPREHDGLTRGVELLARELGRSGVGRLRWPARSADYLGMANPARHHIGTTRMHESPQDGVVDEHCQVHGIPNLHIAGSSVFPTSGIANPTLTLMALAIRLSDRLGLRLKESRQ